MTEISAKTADALGIRLFLEANGAGRQAIPLIEQGATLNVANAEGITTLMCVAAGARIDILKAMLDSGRETNLNARDNHGWTALITAAHRGDAQTLWLLLQAGADATLKDALGRDAFDYAKASGDKAKIQVMAAAMGLPAPASIPAAISARRGFNPFN